VVVAIASRSPISPQEPREPAAATIALMYLNMLLRSSSRRLLPAPAVARRAVRGAARQPAE